MINPQGKLSMDVPLYKVADVYHSYMQTIFNEISSLELLSFAIASKIKVIVTEYNLDVTTLKGYQSVPKIIIEKGLPPTMLTAFKLLTCCNYIQELLKAKSRIEYLYSLLVTRHFFREFSSFFFQEVVNHMIYNNYVFKPHGKTGRFGLVRYNKHVVKTKELKNLTIFEEVPMPVSEEAYYWSRIHESKYLDYIYTIKWRRSKFTKFYQTVFIPHKYTNTKYRDSVNKQSPTVKIKDSLRKLNLNRVDIKHCTEL